MSDINRCDYCGELTILPCKTADGLKACPRALSRFHVEYVDGMPMTMAVTFEEGGQWHLFQPWETARANFPGKSASIHAIRFEDGRVWDAVNGWRSPSPYHYENRVIPEGILLDG